MVFPTYRISNNGTEFLCAHRVAQGPRAFFYSDWGVNNYHRETD